MNRPLALIALFIPAIAAAQTSPTPSFEDPRVQTVAYDPAQPVRLTAFVGTALTVILLQGDRVERIVLSDPAAFDVRATGPADGLTIAPAYPGAAARLLVDTSLRRYEFDLGTGDGLMAAYLVRFVDPAAGSLPPAAAAAPAALTGEYRLSGESALLPSRIGDDGERTYVEWGRYQSLPAVFGIGANGEEEVVDGYMRGGVFTIDRVYHELVFRIDRKRARARRTTGLGTG